MKILHAITGLSVGGAENMLAKLIEEASTRQSAYDPSVLSLMTPGDISQRILNCRVPIDTLGMHQGLPTPSALAKLVGVTRRVRPDIIIGWMHHAVLAATAAQRMLPSRPPVVWNIRHSLSDISHEKPMTRAVLRLCAKLSRIPSAIIYNSHVAARQYEAFGFPAGAAVVIPNGFDCDQFQPRADARAEFCNRFGVDEKATIVGLVARLHPMKQPEVLVEAVRRARAKGRDMHLLIMGNGADDPKSDLTRTLHASLPADRFTTIGHQENVAHWMPAIDIFALSSGWGEGFPNVIGEAMACGNPCVVTDVGDARWIIGENGGIVPPGEPEALADALIALYDIGSEARQRLGEKARQRIIRDFSLPEIARQYEALYDRVLDRAAAAQTVSPLSNDVRNTACAG